MIEGPLVYLFYEEAHLRRGRIVQRPVVGISLGDPALRFDALVDTGSERVLADSSLAIAAETDLDHPVDIEEIGLGGGIVQARFMPVTAYLHPPAGIDIEPITWELDVGFIDGWRPL
jgi:hypothetical protein